MKANSLGKKLIIGLITTTIIMGSMVTNVTKVSAKEIEMEQRTGVPTNKVWSIKMTQAIATEGLAEKVIIKDSNGTTITTKVSVGSDEKTITVAPSTAYEAGKTYTLTILEGILSMDKQNALRDTIKMNFTVSQNTTNPVSPIENNLDTDVYLNGKQVVFPADGIQPKFVAGFLYLPLDTMIKAMGYDLKISVDTKPNITITYPKGQVTGDFKSNVITTPQGWTTTQKPILASTDANGKYTGTYATPGFFYEIFGLEMNYTIAKPTGTVSTITHIVTLDGKLVPEVTAPLGKPEDYQIVTVIPSMNTPVEKLVNLQALVKLIPKEDIMTNEAGRFNYDAMATVSVMDYGDYFQIGVFGNLNNSATGVKIIKAVLNDTVGNPDADEIYSALIDFKSKYSKDESAVKIYANYRATKSSKHQYKITNSGSQIYLDYK